MTDDLIKKDWIDRAIETFRFHRSKLQTHEKWTATLTAKELRRSISRVTEDLKVARWLRTHENEIRKFDHQYQALAWIKEKERKMNLQDLD